MLEGLLWTVLGLIGFAMGALAVPVDVAAQLDVGARTRLTLRIGWLFGLVRLRREMGARKPTAPEKPQERKKARSARIPSLTVIRRGFGLLGEILGRVRIRRAELDFSVGTDDPAVTGELAGFAAPIVVLANALPRTRVTLTPDFTGPRFEGAGEGEIRVVPIMLVPPMVGFALSPEVRRWLFTRR
ncbi:MAG: DUF2953 domain-containing protein [Rhodospirillales bacterium]|nr:DUF2953 domain-containing protein [Rhodospirillales bacterium]